MTHKVTLDSQGKLLPATRFMAFATDMLNRPITLAVQTETIPTPQGKRLVCTVYLFPGQSVDGTYAGERGIYTGASIQSPKDDYDLDAAVEWALYRAGDNYIHRLLHLADPAMRKWVFHKRDSNASLRGWAAYITRTVLPLQIGGMSLTDLNTLQILDDLAEVEDAPTIPQETVDALKKILAGIDVPEPTVQAVLDKTREQSQGHLFDYRVKGWERVLAEGSKQYQDPDMRERMDNALRFWSDLLKESTFKGH